MSHNQNDTKEFISAGDSFTLSFPHIWDYQVDDECVTFFRGVNGVGALQVSSYEADLPHSAEDNLFEYLRDEGQEYKTDDLFSRNGQQFASGSFRKGDWYIKVAFLTKGEQVVFVTYTAAVSDIAGAEVCEADTIMKSIRLTEV